MREGKLRHFDCLKVFLTGERGTDSYPRVAAELNLTHGAARAAVHRLRRRYRELLRAEIARTIADPADVEDEIRALFGALGS